MVKLSHSNEQTVKVCLLALLRVVFYFVFVTFPYSVPGQVRYLIVSISELCLLNSLLCN